MFNKIKTIILVGSLVGLCATGVGCICLHLKNRTLKRNLGAMIAVNEVVLAQLEKRVEKEQKESENKEGQ